DRQAVRGRVKRRDHKQALRIRESGAGETCAHLESGHFGIRNGSAFGVGNSAGNTTETLRMRRDRNEEECEKNKQDMLLHFSLPFRGVPETKVRACPTNDHRVRQSSTKWPRTTHHS